MIKLINKLFFNKSETFQRVPKVEHMKCQLNRKFHECDVHRCSTYGCLNCYQFQNKE